MVWDAEKQRAYNQQYYLNNRDRIRQQKAEYAANNREQKRAYDRSYYLVNRSWILQRSADYVMRNRERTRANQRKHYVNHREQRLIYAAMRRSQLGFKENQRKYSKNWYAYCQLCRKRLRRLVEQVPAVAPLIINLDDATDGQVRQFHDQLMEDIKHGYRY